MSPLYALAALVDVRANVDAAILAVVRQLHLARPPASWEAIARVLGISPVRARVGYRDGRRRDEARDLTAETTLPSQPHVSPGNLPDTGV